MIGWIMLSIPAAVLFVHVAKTDGIKDALKIYLAIAAFVSWLTLASYLMRSA